MSQEEQVLDFVCRRKTSLGLFLVRIELFKVLFDECTFSVPFRIADSTALSKCGYGFELIYC